MKIGIIWHSEFPWNRGIGALGKGLYNYGHQVVILAKKGKHEKKVENLEYCRIYRFPYLFDSKFYKLFSCHFPLNVLWVIFIIRTVRKEDLKVLIVRDLPLALPSILASKILGIPILWDIRENYPAMYKVKKKKNVLIDFLKNPFLAEKLENFCLKFVRHVFVNVEEQKDRLLKKGIEEEKITVTYNCVELDFISKALNLSKNFRVNNKDCICLLYIGSLDHRRGLENVIKAIPKVLEKKRNIIMNIVGEGFMKKKLEHLVKYYKLEKIIKFHSFYPPEKVPEIIYKHDIGIINHIISEHTNTTVPGKLYEFLACGKPVICSATKPMSRLIREIECGLIVKEGKVEEIAKAILKLIEDKKLREQMGRNGQQAILTKYNWDRQMEKIMSVIRNFYVNYN